MLKNIKCMKLYNSIPSKVEIDYKIASIIYVKLIKDYVLLKFTYHFESPC